MKSLKCISCGAPVKMSPMYYDDYYVCEYCGQRYKNENDRIIKVETYTNPVRTIECKECISQDVLEFYRPDQISEIMMKSITRNLADSLAPFMRIEQEYDPACMKHTITARIRLIEDDYRF